MSNDWQPRIPPTRWWERSFLVHVIQRWTIDLVRDAWSKIRPKKKPADYPRLRDISREAHWQDFKHNPVDWITAWLVPRWMYRLYRWVRHPVGNYQYWRRVRQCPKPGEYAMYHDEGPYKVLSWDECGDIVLDTPHGPYLASWTNCCDLPPKGWKP